MDLREGLELKMFLCACFMNIGAGHDTAGSGCYFSSEHQVFVGNNKGWDMFHSIIYVNNQL